MKQEQLQSKREHSREEGGLETPRQTPLNVDSMATILVSKCQQIDQ